MNGRVAAWLAISILFEVVGDIFVKRASLGQSVTAWLIALLAYVLMLLAWFAAIAEAKVITVPGIAWLLCGQLALVAVGCGLFGERLSTWQAIGVALAFPAVALLCVG